MDIYDKKKRSEIMSAVRSRGNQSTELKLIKAFKSARICGWRRGIKIIGNPDFVFSREKVVVFVDGCFWHGCPKHFKVPKTNDEFWRKKIRDNSKRDRYVKNALCERGWKVIRLWEHAIKKNAVLCAKRVQVALRDRLAE